MTLTAIDLFAGAGGASLGLTRAGFTVVAAVDTWEVATQTHAQNMTHPVYCEDASAWDAERVRDRTGLHRGELDLLVGGPPCQGFSIQRVGSDDDHRNDLVMAFARSACDLQPRAFFMENVTGLLGRRGKALHAAAVLSLQDAGYVVDTRTVNAVDFGLPQSRRRVLVRGVRKDQRAFVPRDPGPIHVPRTVWDAIGDLPDPAGPGIANLADPMHVESRLSDLNRLRLKHIPPGGGFEDLPVDLRVACHKAGAAAIGHRGVYGRLAPDAPSGTITARFDSFTRGRFAHPYVDRNLTMREGARLQGFPDDFQFVGNREEVAAQIGNAVPPPLAEAVGRDLAMHLAQSLDPDHDRHLASSDCV